MATEEPRRGRIAPFSGPWESSPSGNRYFFSALEKRDRAAFHGQMGMVLVLRAASVTTAVLHLYAKQMLQHRWLVHPLQRQCLEGGGHHRMGFVPGAADNPDQRISEDTRRATATAVGLLHSALTSSRSRVARCPPPPSTRRSARA
jgi:ABC-type uncharacterized transport system fused permease/ATPase subunit